VLQTPNPRISTALTSTSLDRAQGPSTSFVLGKSGHVPFWPGGLDDVLVNTGDADSLDNVPKGLRTVPPGLSRGLRLPGEEIEDDLLVELDEISSSKPLQNGNMVCHCLQFQHWFPMLLRSLRLFSLAISITRVTSMLPWQTNQPASMNSCPPL
jgi:hypothetical protein